MKSSVPALIDIFRAKHKQALRLVLAPGDTFVAADLQLCSAAMELLKQTLREVRPPKWQLWRFRQRRLITRVLDLTDNV